MHQKHNQTMERRMTGNCHVRCEAGENPEITSKDYLSLFGRIPNFAETLAVVRKYNIRMCIVLQGLSQLRAIYDKKTDNVLTNCSVITFLGTIDEETNKFISDKIGTTTVRDDTRSFNTGNQGGGSKSESYHERPLLKPNEIALAIAERPSNNNIGSCIVFVKGFYPFFLTKYDLSKHQAFNEIGSFKGENQKNNANIYADYEELKEQHMKAYKDEKADKHQVSGKFKDVPQTGLTTDQQREEDLDAFCKELFENSPEEIVFVNDPAADEFDEVTPEGTKEVKWNG